MKIGGFIDFDMLITIWWATMGPRWFFGPLGEVLVDFWGQKNIKNLFQPFLTKFCGVSELDELIKNWWATMGLRPLF